MLEVGRRLNGGYLAGERDWQSREGHTGRRNGCSCRSAKESRESESVRHGVSHPFDRPAVAPCGSELSSADNPACKSQRLITAVSVLLSPAARSVEL